MLKGRDSCPTSGHELDNATSFAYVQQSSWDGFKNKDHLQLQNTKYIKGPYKRQMIRLTGTAPPDYRQRLPLMMVDI